MIRLALEGHHTVAPEESLPRFGSILELTLAPSDRERMGSSGHQPACLQVLTGFHRSRFATTSVDETVLPRC